MMVVSDGENTAALAIFDFISIAPAMNAKIKQAIADAIDVQSVIVDILNYCRDYLICRYCLSIFWKTFQPRNRVDIINGLCRVFFHR